MNTLLEIPQLLYTLLIQLACGIVLASQFAPGERAYIRQQTMFAFTFLFLAPLLCAVLEHSLPPAESHWEMYCIGALGAGLIADFWLKYEPGAKSFEKILDWMLAFICIALLFCISLPYGNTVRPGLASLSAFFLFLASALLLGSIWVAMTGTRRSWESDAPLPGNVFSEGCCFFAVPDSCSPQFSRPLRCPCKSRRTRSCRPRQPVLPTGMHGIAAFPDSQCSHSLSRFTARTCSRGLDNLATI